MSRLTRYLSRQLFDFPIPPLPAYGLLYFDQLRSEKEVFFADPQQFSPPFSDTDKEILDRIDAKREAHRQDAADESEHITWQDIYTYELILLKYRDFDDLKSKILSLRTKYRNVAGQKEYDIYLASKPPDLAAVTDPDEQTDLLRGDCEYLLREFVSLYSYMTAREQLRSKLLRWAASLTLAFLVIAGLVMWLYSAATIEQTDRPDTAASTPSPRAGQTPAITPASGSTNVGDANADTGSESDAAVSDEQARKRSKVRGIGIVLVVVFAGVMGAFVSIHLRIQSLPSEGDPVYTFSTLMHGWFGIFLSPVSGAIFAVVLYLFFTAQLLTGKIFPTIATHNAPAAASPAPTPTPAQTPTPSQTPASPAGSAATLTLTPTPSTLTPTPTATPRPTQTPRQTQTPEGARTPAVNQTPASATTATDDGRASAEPTGLNKFLTTTGPASGVDFALLVIWSFIAGFAERFVPDTLTRLISRNDAAQGRRV